LYLLKSCLIFLYTSRRIISYIKIFFTERSSPRYFNILWGYNFSIYEMGSDRNDFTVIRPSLSIWTILPYCCGIHERHTSNWGYISYAVGGTVFSAVWWWRWTASTCLAFIISRSPHNKILDFNYFRFYNWTILRLLQINSQQDLLYQNINDFPQYTCQNIIPFQSVAYKVKSS
jgi:hypothetical protein